MRSISPTILPYHASPRKPNMCLPLGAVDSHCHIFGPDHLYPYVEGRPYTPHDAPLEKLISLHDHLGIDRAVIVNATCHGRDNRPVTDAIGQYPKRFRGVGNIDLNNTSIEIKTLNEQGIRGCRFTFIPRLGKSISKDDFIEISKRIAEVNWHVDLYLPSNLIPDFHDTLINLPINYVIDHLGVDLKAFQNLRHLYANDPKCHIKLSCPERLTSKGAPFNDIAPFAKTLIMDDPTRLFWGTDWPHPNVPFMPDDGDLVDWLGGLASEAEIEQITVKNPQTFFGF